jgi:hypothetical protein
VAAGTLSSRPCAHSPRPSNRLCWWRRLACGLGVPGLIGWVLRAGSAADAQLLSLPDRLAALEGKLARFTLDAATSEVVSTGANLRLLNGLGFTDTVNSMGNLIMRYNEPRKAGRTGVPARIRWRWGNSTHNLSSPSCRLSSRVWWNGRPPPFWPRAHTARPVTSRFAPWGTMPPPSGGSLAPSLSQVHGSATARVHPTPRPPTVLIAELLPQRTAPELLFMETKWASLSPMASLCRPSRTSYRWMPGLVIRSCGITRWR